MIVSVHLAQVGPAAIPGLLRSKRRLAARAAAIYAEPVLTAPLGGGLLPRPSLGGGGLVAAWEDDAALDEFLAWDPVADRLGSGWHVRLQPLHVFGSWAALPGLPAEGLAVEEDEPVVALTLGRLRLRRAPAFLASSSRAEAAALSHPGLLASTGLARPPHLVATFSVWRSLGDMRDYAFGSAGAHRAAVGVHRERPFHSESAFIRFRPYASSGSWQGRDPLALALA